MKDLFKKLILMPLVLAVISNTGALTPLSSATIPKTEAATICSEWTMVWDGSTGDSIDTIVPIISPNPIQSGDIGFDSATAPTSPALVKGSYWKCTKGYDSSINDPVVTQEEKSQSQGTEMCQKAVRIATKFGGYAALDGDFASKIQKSVLGNSLNFLKSEISKGVDINISDIGFSATTQQFFDKTKGNAVKTFDSIIGNPLKNSVSKEADKIMSGAKKMINDGLNKAGLDALGDLGGLGGMLGGGGSKVPVEDVNTKDAVEKSSNNMIAEQKRQAVIQDTRDKCNVLLTTTVATVKRTILYQLSTQITDWITTGKEPQFISQPGKFLEDTGRLALDRFISNVAPQLCQPFRLDVQIQIPAVTRQTNPFYEQVRCTLDQVTNNVNNFYKDFRQGGWLTYQEILKPQNNYYGASLMVQNAAQIAAADAVAQAQEDLSQGRGFKSQKSCSSWTYFTPTAGVPYRADKLQNGINYKAQEFRADYNPTEDGFMQNSIRPSQYWDISNQNFWECQSYENTTPGTVAANLSEKAAAVDLDAMAPDSVDIENFLQTIQDSIVNKLTKSGVKGLKTLLPDWVPASIF